MGLQYLYELLKEKSIFYNWILVELNELKSQSGFARTQQKIRKYLIDNLLFLRLLFVHIFPHAMGPLLRIALDKVEVLGFQIPSFKLLPPFWGCCFVIFIPSHLLHLVTGFKFPTSICHFLFCFTDLNLLVLSKESDRIDKAWSGRSLGFPIILLIYQFFVWNMGLLSFLNTRT